MEILSFTWLVYFASVLAISCFFLDLVIHKSAIGLHVYTMVTDRNATASVRLVLSRFSGSLDDLLGKKLVSRRAFSRVLPFSIALNFVIVAGAVIYISSLQSTSMVTTSSGGGLFSQGLWMGITAILILVLPFFIYAFFDFLSVCITRKLIRRALNSGKMVPFLVFDTLLSTIILWFQAYFSFVAVILVTAVLINLSGQGSNETPLITRDLFTMSYKLPIYAFWYNDVEGLKDMKYFVGGLALLGASNLVLTIIYWIFAFLALLAQFLLMPFSKSTQFILEQGERLPRSFFSSVGTLLGAFIVYSQLP